mgnify:CR=1 FL=1
MRVNITSKGFTANDRQVALIEKKFEKLSKFFPEETTVNVTMGFKKNRQTMEAMISVKGMIFRAEFTDTDMNVCLDKVVERHHRSQDIRKSFRKTIRRSRVSISDLMLFLKLTRKKNHSLL